MGNHPKVRNHKKKYAFVYAYECSKSGIMEPSKTN